MRYMLDTNIVAFAKNNRPEIVLERMGQFEPGDLCVSSITLAELEYGVFNSSNPDRNQLALTLFLASIEASMSLFFDVRTTASPILLTYTSSPSNRQLLGRRTAWDPPFAISFAVIIRTTSKLRNVYMTVYTIGRKWATGHVEKLRTLVLKMLVW